MIFKPIAAAALFLVGQGKLTSATHEPGHWELKADIYPDDPDGSNPDLTPDYGFGWSVDYSGDTLIAGSYRAGKWDDDIGGFLPGGGSARVFVRSDPSSNVGWVQQGPPLVVSDGVEEYVGYRVAIDGNRAIVVAGRGEGYGMVKMFVFERTDGTWAQTTILEFPDAYNDNSEMPRVVLEGDVAIIGRPFPTDGVGSGTANGKVFIYKNIAGTWDATPAIIEAPASEKKDGDYFGVDVAVSNGILLVGADEREAWDIGASNYQAVRKGKVYVFVDNNDGSGYVHSQTLEPDTDVPDGFRFGSYLALDGDNALIGNSCQSCLGEDVPSVHGFTRSDGSWVRWFTTSSSSVCGYGHGVALKDNQGLINTDWGGNVRLIDLTDSGFNVDLYPPSDHHGYSDSRYKNGKWFALGNGEVFVGRDRGLNGQYAEEGSVHVYDNFSEIPLGEEVLTYISSQSWGTSFSVTYEAGRGQQVEVELFKSDCSTPIENWDIINWWHPTSGWEKSLTHDLWEFSYWIRDLARLDEVGIYNSDTWQIEICHKARLVSSSTVEDVQNLFIDADLNPEGAVAGSFGDPHIMTFDELSFDCQAAGVFTTLTSLEDDTFMIQERFTAVSSDSCSQASVSTGVVVADRNKPIIQVSTPGLSETSLNAVTANKCPIDFFVGGVESVLGEEDLSDSNVVVRVDKWETNRIKIIHTDTLLSVDVVVQQSATFGCHMMVQVSLPDTFRLGETLLGLLGTPNGDMTDDWVASDGTAVHVPATEADRLFSTAYNYCVTNWCVQEDADSLFTLRSSETFGDINQCSMPYSDSVETAVQDVIAGTSIHQYLSGVCSNYGGITSGLRLACVVDGLCGDIGEANSALNDQWNIHWMSDESKSSEYSPLESSSPAWEVKAEILPDDSTDFTPDLSPDDGFGWSVAISGEMLVVGSYNNAMFDWETQSYGPGQGSCRVFRRVDSSNLSWEQVGSPLIVADPENPTAKYVGYRVAIDGSTALIAAVREGNGVKKSKVFVFELSANGAWEQTALLPIENLDDGRTPQVALQGDTAVIGVGYIGNGRVFVFKKLGSWAQVAILEASDGQPGDYFGADVSISGNTILVGASQQDLKDVLNDGSRVPAQVRRGKAYIFVNNDDGNGWVQEAIIQADQYASEQLQFGAAVSLDGETAFIGHGNFWGNAYVYHRSFSDWTLQEKLSPLRTSWDSWTFGKSVSVLGDLAIVGGGSGEATLFERKRSGWSVKSLLRGYSWNSPSRHGRMVALGTNFAVVGTDSGAGQVGKVEVFDDFSIVPPGPEEINLFYNRTIGSPDFIDFVVGYAVGYTREVQFELFEKDCQTAIAEIMFIKTTQAIGPYRGSVSEDFYHYWMRFDPEAVKGSTLHNQVTWEVEVCAVASLVDSPGVTVQHVFKIPFFEGAPPGAVDVIFQQSWTGGNGIWATYLIGRDQNHTAHLYQKDCETNITDTSITIEQPWLYTMNFTYDSVGFGYTLDRNTIRDSVIFNSTSSEIEVCHVVALTDAPDKVDRQVIRIFVPPPNRFGGLFGDPHIMTFDELSFDCQAAGEFTTLTSLDDPTFKIQERFTAIESGTCAQASVSTGVVVADTGKPVVQISTPRNEGTSSLNTVNDCPIDFYINGTASVLETDLSSSNIEVSLDQDSSQITIKHTDTLLALNVVVGNSDSFGCHVMVQVGLPGTFRSHETLLGLLGTPNGNKDDDWLMPNGTIVPAPTSDAERLFSTAYNYCVENWCAKTASESLFTYRTNESFVQINKCGVPFSSEVEEAVNDQDNLDQVLVNACGGNLVCLVDGLCGDITDAFAALSSEEEIVTTQVEVKTASVFPRERVDIQNVEPVTTTTSTTTATTTSSSSSTTTPSSTAASSSTTTTSSVAAVASTTLSTTTTSSVAAVASTTLTTTSSIAAVASTASSTTAGTSSNTWYPNWGKSEQTCKNDGVYDPYMETGNYLKKTLEECCKSHYWWAVDECLILGGWDSSKVASGEFYVDYASESCKQSCLDKDASATKNCGGLAPKWKETFKKADDCCANKLFWVNTEACVAASTLTDIEESEKGSKRWFVDWISYKCVKDCVEGTGEHCGGIAQAWDQTFDTAVECCNTKLPWLKNSKCTGTGNNS